MDLTSEDAAHRPGMESLARTSRHFTAKGPEAEPGPGGPDPAEDDSGVFNSSKNTTSSEVEAETNDQDSEAERVGCFDYFSVAEKKVPAIVPQKKDSSNCEIKERNTLAYDAVFDADADIVTSDSVKRGDFEDCDRPGHYGASAFRAKQKFEYELSTMTEMKTFHRSGRGSDSSDPYDDDLIHQAELAVQRDKNELLQQVNSIQYDEAYTVHSDNSGEHDSSLEEVVVEGEMKQSASGDSSDEHLAQQVQDINIHQQLYSDSAYHHPPYQPLSNSDEEEATYQPRFNSYSHGRSYPAEPDRKISFPLSRVNPDRIKFSANMGSGHTSDMVKVEKSIKSKDKPPFGDPLNVKRIERSSERLIDFHRSSRLEAPNMPQASPITSQADREEEKKKKKRKKKKEAADKLDSGGSEQQDENGNPLETASPALGGPAAKKPYSPSGLYGDLHSGPYSNDTKSKFPTSIQAMEGLGFSPMDLEDSSAASREHMGQYAKMKAKREKRQSKEKKMLSEEIPGYVGKQDIDQILSMIEGQQPERNAGAPLANKKQNKAAASPQPQQIDSTPAPVTDTDDFSSALEKEMLNNKSKKKKRKSGDGGKETSVKNHVTTKDSNFAAGEKDSDGSSTSSEQPKELVYPTKIATTNGLDEGSSNNYVNDYKFTDFEEVPKVSEGEFVTVAKKKKPVAVKKDQYQNNNRDNMQKDKYYSRKDYYTPRNQTADRILPVETNNFERERGDRERYERVEKRPVSRSTTSEATPPATPGHDSQSGDGETDRALSPSHFPVLSARPPSRVVRRNSTGNVPAPEVNYDSDLESVKSVPLVAGGLVAKEIDGRSSPGPAAGPVGISYASIAAGKKPHGPAASSSASSGGSVQKLSPTTPPELEPGEPGGPGEEGSALPSEVSQTESVPSPGGSTDNGREETFVLASEDFDGSAQPATRNGTSEINMSVNLTLPGSREPSVPAQAEPEPSLCEECEESVEFTYRFSETDPKVLERIRPPHSSHTARPGCSKCSSQISSETLPSPVSPVPQGSPLPSQPPTTAAGPGQALADTGSGDRPGNNNVAAKQANPKPSCDPSAGGAPTSKPTTNKSKRASKLSKSVIFLNEKMNQPTNLGISFGFEEDLGDFPPLINNRTPPVNNSMVGGGSASEFSVSFGESGLMPSPKPRFEMPLNGITVPQGLPLVITVTREATVGVKPGAGPPPTGVAAPTPDPKALDPQTAPQTNGFNFLPPTDYSKESDPNFDCGSFDRETACYFLWKDWQTVHELRNNGKVKLYSELS